MLLGVVLMVVMDLVLALMLSEETPLSSPKWLTALNKEFIIAVYTTRETNLQTCETKKKKPWLCQSANCGKNLFLL